MVGFKQQSRMEEDDSTYSDDFNRDMKRRVSWAFDNPLLPPGTKSIGLIDTKALLRSQMRDKTKLIPPDFIYLSVNNIQANMKPIQASKHMEVGVKRVCGSIFQYFKWILDMDIPCEYNTHTHTHTHM